MPLIQQRFSVFLSPPKGAVGKRLDITEDVDEVTLNYDQNFVQLLSIDISNPEKYIGFLDTNYIIDFYGGYLDREDYFELDANQRFSYNKGNAETDKFKHLFKGTILFLQYRYASNGLKSATMDIRDFSSLKTSEGLSYAYPSNGSNRKFKNGATTLTVTDIVRGIADELGLEANVDPAVNAVYTLKNQAIQKNISDWAFLRQLAHANGCYVWTSNSDESGKYTINFIDKAKCINDFDKRIQFVWLDRETDNNFGFIQNSELLKEATDNVNESSKFKANQVPIISATIDVNPQVIGANMLSISSFDPITGDEKTDIVTFDEKTQEYITYTLNNEKVDALVKTNPDLAREILDMGAFGITKEVFLPYYTPVRTKKGSINAVDRPFYGISVNNAVVHGNINIIPYQSYSIVGIGKWSTSKDMKVMNHYLRGLTHRWTRNDFLTTLEFMG